MIKEESTPKPISQSNVPIQFNVVAFTDSGKPALLEHEIGLQTERRDYLSKADFRKAFNERALWNEECNNSRKYSFYIDASKKQAIEKNLTAALADLQSVTINILEDRPSERRQKVRIDFLNDDFEYYSVYAVNNRSITLMGYGDLLKRDGVVASLAGLKYAIAVYLFGRLALAIVMRYQCKRKQPALQDT